MKKILKNLILYLIQFIEKHEYNKLQLNENDDSKKILNSINLNNIEIETDNGFKPISAIHITQPYTIWKITLENGVFLEGADNHVLFDENYNHIFIKYLKINDLIQTKYGLSKIIEIKKYIQKISMYDVTVDSLEHRFYSNNILSHNTTTISAFFAWKLCFSNDRNHLILANKEKTTIEIVSKVVDVFRGLPFFLKPGIKNIGATGLSLDNGCKLVSQATTKTASIGFTIHVLYMDEFAHIQSNIARSFWRSVYPTLSSSLISQCIISSTPNGMDNLFYELWDKANKKENSFGFKRVDYWEVPGHDDEWAEQMKKDFGEDEFAQEFELSFDRKSNLLLGGSQLTWLKKLEKPYVYVELEKTELDEILYRNKLLWDPNFDPNKDFNILTNRFVLSNDIAEGKEEKEKKDNDYNVTTIFKVELKSLAKLRKLRKDEHTINNLFRLRQVGIYRDNINDENVMANINKAIVFDQFGTDICKLVTEMNFNGKAFLKEFSDHEDYYEDIMMKSYHTVPIPGDDNPRKKIGYKTRSDKDYFCKLGKKLIENYTIIPSDSDTYSEFAAFGKVKNSWKGVAKHDDSVMTTLNLSRLYSEEEYLDWLYDFLDQMPVNIQKELAMKILEEPFDKNEISDEMFNIIHSEVFSEEAQLKNIFEEGQKNRNSTILGMHS